MPTHLAQCRAPPSRSRREQWMRSLSLESHCACKWGRSQTFTGAQGCWEEKGEHERLLTRDSPADQQAPGLCPQIVCDKYFQGLILTNTN